MRNYGVQNVHDLFSISSKRNIVFCTSVFILILVKIELYKLFVFT